jgi:hypothetical protein
MLSCQNPVSTTANSLGSESPLSRRVFQAQGGPRQKLKKHVQNRLEMMSFPHMSLKILYVVCSPNGNVKRPVTSFLEKDEIVFTWRPLALQYLPWPKSHVTCLFWMLTAKKSLKQKNSEKMVFLEKCFLHIFASGLSPYNNAFQLILQKVPKIWKSKSYETWAGEILPPRKNMTCHVTAPPVLTWRTQLFITVSCVRRGKGEGP